MTKFIFIFLIFSGSMEEIPFLYNRDFLVCSFMDKTYKHCQFKCNFTKEGYRYLGLVSRVNYCWYRYYRLFHDKCRTYDILMEYCNSCFIF